MRVVVGLGNPGAEYARTRHNCGFLVLDELARRRGAGTWRQRWQAEVAELPDPQGKVLLLKPQTYMNGSGAAVQAVMAFHHLAPSDLLVVVDDINLALGNLRLRPDGSAGGHNGLRDIEARIGPAYPRLRLGVGQPPGPDVQRDFVLAAFTEAERPDALAMVAKAADAVESWIADGMGSAQRFNGPLRPPERPQRPPKPAPPTDPPPIPAVAPHPASP